MPRAFLAVLAFVTRGANVLSFAAASPRAARYTLRFHLPAEVLLGAVAGITTLGDLIARKTLRTPDYLLALQSSIPTVALLFAMVWRDLLDGVPRRKVLVLTGVFGKGLLLFTAFATSPGLFFAVLVAFSFADSAFIPVRNSIFRSNYPDNVRGRLFGGVVSLMNLALIAANLLAAAVLDRWEWSYRLLLPVAAVLGLAAHLIYARIKVRGDGQHEGNRPSTPIVSRAAGAVVRGFASTVRILRRDRDFRTYEAGFFLYGLGFLMNLPLVVILISDRLHLSYGQASWARFVVPPVLMILCSPVAGRLLDRTHSSSMMAASCLLLAAHSALLAAATGFWTLLASFALHGVAMTGVNLAWNLGPVQFARTHEESLDYMGVHVTLTGVRGLLAPLLALGARHFLGLTPAFFVATGFFALAALLQWRLARRVTRAAAPAAEVPA